MLTEEALLVTLNLVLWVTLGYRFLRAFQHRKLKGGASLYAWGGFFLLYLVVALKAPPIEDALDGLFDHLPVTLIVRSTLILLTAQVYLFLIGEAAAVRLAGTRRVFHRVNPLIILLCIVLFVLLLPPRVIPFTASEHIIKTVRDAAMIAWAALVFIPAGLYLWQTERVRPTKLLHSINLLFFVAYLLNCIGELTWALVYSFAPQWEDALVARLQYLDYLCIVLLLMMLFPFRRLMPLFYPGRLWLYLRLRLLERKVTRLTTIKPQTKPLPLNLLHPDGLELTIYQSTIAILDCYPGIVDRGARERIREVVARYPKYSDLVGRLASVQI